MWSKIVQFVSRLPVAKFLKPVWKAALRLAVGAAFDKAEAELMAKIEKEGPAAVDKYIDALQLHVRMGITALPLPEGIEIKLIDLVQDRGDALQATIKAAVEQQAPAVVRTQLEIFRAQVLEKINSL
jgi:hypothetical protein